MTDERKICVGTSGWSYPRGEGTWKGHFYPPGTSNELAYYSSFFNTVEINSSFYRPPDPKTSKNWVNTVPADFFFSVKLWQKFTHPDMYKAATGREAVISLADVDLFKYSIEPIAAAGKLGALLAQFPPGFTSNRDNQRTLRAVVETFRGYQLAVELRHRSWSDDTTTAGLLRKGGASWVRIDEPKFSSSVAQELPQTADFSYFRLHGRNREMWWKGSVETRYKYLYSPEEIRQLAEQVKQAGEKVKCAFIYFNNHWQAYAPRNALGMMKALGIPVKAAPSLFMTLE
ncbi:MAG: DUF72 domain-containing protein [Dehalococcoidales bacterium]|nr:DUF72 domain-containing protein [Dehalococcoidales bacterium]